MKSNLIKANIFTVTIILIFNCSCNTAKLDYKQKIIKNTENYLSTNYSTNKPYEALIKTFKCSENRQEFDTIFISLIPLLVQNYRLSMTDKQPFYHYFDNRISSNGKTYISFNLKTNSYIHQLSQSDNTLFRDYSNIILTLGDITPSLIAGTKQWHINMESPDELKFLFAAHLMIVTNKYANSNTH